MVKEGPEPPETNRSFKQAKPLPFDPKRPIVMMLLGEEDDSEIVVRSFA